MYKICFATHNAHKVRELKSLLPDHIELISLDELGQKEEIPETGSALDENSELKARFVWDHYQMDCIADDSGLEVEALGGAPGVYSARYAGSPKNDQANVAKLLKAMEGISNRAAAFRTVITFLKGGKSLQFEGMVRGTIAHAPRGSSGFGYDPVFIPNGYDKTFAEMSPEEKNKLSHRGRAVGLFVDFVDNAQF
jgi:XTP/dITP diphosphohydrolase